MDAVSNYSELVTSLGAAFTVRVLASVVSWTSCLVALTEECRSRKGGLNTDNYMIVTQSRTIEEVMEDENEEDGQLL